MPGFTGVWRTEFGGVFVTITSMRANAIWTTRGHAYLNSISFRGPEFDPVAYLG